ncbi:RsfA family transcriptional regulator [Paenibacillus sp. 1781tsa1]|uniref:RsfA family transcriptional regulator n=1 Tax=Paenibacillus sp. 1781tsa1 TaxID=2953810 RepID=UPI00209EE789|nr:RsfA family transcriptional regulator [Paenibacillus sp. 1781tsa1]MCP1185033.1 RsfA family transcriptional regulator [Paenibacillus sp. 1781tsa1]
MERKDNWTKEEDLLLSTIILTKISKGETQLSGFTDVGLKLNRTAAACGFRWNSTIRHIYKKEILKAKLTKLRNKQSPSQPPKKYRDIEDIITYIQQVHNDLLAIESQIEVYRTKIRLVSLEIDSRRSERTLDALQNQEALTLLLAKAAELGLFEHNKKPAI